MRTRASHFTLTLLLIAMSALLYGGTAPALAAGCTPGAVDKPDLSYADSNCDGIDGDKATAIFVAPGGSDANDGSFGHPMATVTAAVTAALAANRDVYVAAGTYTGKVAFLGSGGHIGVYGGYDPITWHRSVLNLTTLQAPTQVVGIADPGIVLQLLTIHGLVDATTHTSYAVRAFYGGSVALSHDVIEPGNGVAGYSGANAPQTPPAAAPDGHQGVGAADCDENALTGTFNYGATGGSGAGLLSGGQGGDWHRPMWPYAGDDGQGDPGVPGGPAAQDLGWSGGSGSPGKPGAAGLPGYADLNQVALFYSSLPGTDGGSGTRGAGGGGGAMSVATCVPGSGGGAGGRPGAGGAGGQGGGGSIGVFLGDGAHAVILDGTTIHAGNGGKGGNGGLGQPGGAGGDGGPAGVDFYAGDNNQWPGGPGGHGGAGGPGGQGGGAAGGASVGVLAIDARATIKPDTVITSGSGGQSGTGGHNGWTGASMQIAQQTTASGTLPAVGDFDGDGVNDVADACPIAPGPGSGCPLPAADPPAGGQPASPPDDQPAPAGPLTTIAAPALGAPSTPTTAKTLGVHVLPSATACLSKRRFVIHIDAHKAKIATATVKLGTRALRVSKGKKRWTATVDLRGKIKATYMLSIRGRLTDGRAYAQTRRYHTCARLR